MLNPEKIPAVAADHSYGSSVRRSLLDKHPQLKTQYGESAEILLKYLGEPEELRIKPADTR